MKAQICSKFSSSIGANVFQVKNIINHLDIPLIGVNNHHTELDGPMNVYGVYYRMDWDISSKIKLRGGVRFDKTNSFNEIRKYNLGNNYFDPEHQVLDSFYTTTYRYPERDINVLPELALLYSLNDYHTLKFIYGAAINQTPPFKTKDAAQGIKPEFIRNIEVNHTGMISKKIMLNTSIFYNRYYELVTVEFYIKDNTPVQKATNSGEISSLGWESIIEYRPSKKLSFAFSGSYYHSTDSNHPDIYPAFSPQFLGGLNAAYRFRSFSVAVTNQFVSATEPKYSHELSNMDDMNSPPIGRVGKTAPAYINTGFNIRYSPLRYKFLYANLRISNVLNQKMYYPVNDYNSWATNGTLGISRTVLFTMGYTFK